jgi:uncharacterized protein (TIGR00730 family)
MTGMRLCVFCGSAPGRGDRYVDAARSLGRLLAERGITVVYGGASVGTMGVVADAALEAGGEVIGVIPAGLVDREIAHQRLTDLRVVGSMHARKAMMAELANGFIALPGGIGTLEELFEVWTLAHLGLHSKPLALLDLNGFYQPLRGLIDHMVEERFLLPTSRDLVRFCADPEAAVSYLDGGQARRSSEPTLGGPSPERLSWDGSGQGTIR